MPRNYRQRAALPLLERITAKINVDGVCWEWTGAKNKYGYGAIQRGRRTGVVRVHRALWEELVGPVPDGLELDHLCRNRACCNPDHLEPVTRQVNVDRGSRAAGRPRRTHCTHGHPLTPDNTRPSGACRQCANNRNREYRARNTRSPR